jgi:hypothetical protein
MSAACHKIVESSRKLPRKLNRISLLCTQKRPGTIGWCGRFISKVLCGQCGCGSRPAFRLVALGRTDLVPAFGTAEPRLGVESSPRSREGFSPRISALISSPVSVSYSSKPFGDRHELVVVSVRILRASV